MPKPREPQWVNDNVVLDIHDAQLAEHGGLEGVRDQGLLESALQAPRQAWAYTDPAPDLCMLAAVYATRIAKNHAFNDGNKRTGAVVAETFLLINGLELVAPDDELHQAILDVANGVLHESTFAEWLRQRVEE